MTNIKILVCCHKKDICASQYPYLPIQVGKKNSLVNLGIQGDDIGDNISEKNPYYAELTGMYWAWKNLKDVDIIGLCHYRRYFDFHHQIVDYLPCTKLPASELNKLDLSIPKNIVSKLSNSIVVAKRNNSRHSVYHDYCSGHISDDFHVLEKVISEHCDVNYLNAFNKIMYRNNKCSLFNMFIMSWGNFDSYCKWLFSIFSEMEKHVDLSNRTPSQNRIFGFMAERLLNVYIEANNLKTIERPVIWLDNNPKNGPHNRIKHLIRCFLNNMSLWLVR